MISGGTTDGDSHRARRSHSRRLESLNINRQVPEGLAIEFGPEDLQGVDTPHDDALVIRATIANYEVARVFVDTGSSVNILFKTAFDRMQVEETDLKPMNTALFGFAGHEVRPLGQIHLPISLGSEPARRTRTTSFSVVDAASAYNVILGRPALNTFQAVVSTFHQKIKFPVGEQVGEVAGDQATARRCYVEMVRAGSRKRARPGEIQTVQDSPVWVPTEAEEVLLTLDPPERKVRISAELSKEVREALEVFFLQNQDVFAWSMEDLGHIAPHVMEHRLNLKTEVRPVKQKRRHFGAEKDLVIHAEVDRLLKAGHIREIQFPTWLANVVLVPKPGGQWRVCVDFRDLNKACPKDCYPLPRIDQLVDSTAGCALICMLDAQQGYHQIPLAESDQDKVSFITSGGTYCYTVMPFGLKNAGATYQRLMDRIFKRQIGRNIEVYVDDILIKTRRAECLISDINETFQTLRRFGLKLNPHKCVFGVQKGKFLGYVVTERGIEPNPLKVRSLHDMPAPTNIREVQRLTGRITALSRFISRSAERSLPFFKLLRKASKFEWDARCQDAFEALKAYLADLPTLSQPRAGETLWLYLAVSEGALGAALVREENGKQQPVYFTGHVLKEVESRYTELEKLALVLTLTARKLRPYFLSHPITVLTNSGLGRVLTNPQVSGRLIKWMTELGEYDIQYQPRNAIKAQALADFMAETLGAEGGETWEAYVDGAANKQGSGVGVVLISPKKDTIQLAVQLGFRLSNNEAEYEALLAGMKAARQVGAERLVLFSDSQLVVQQITGTFEVNNERLQKYLSTYQKMAGEFQEIHLRKIPRADNGKADELAKMASSLGTWEDKEKILKVQYVAQIEQNREESTMPDWRQEVITFLKGTAPPDPASARLLRKKAARFTLVGEQLYRRSFSRPLLKCVSLDEADYILREIHEGCCGNHDGARSLIRKVLLAGYFWPTLIKDAQRLVRTCLPCQKHQGLQHRPTEHMRAAEISCPFDQWGMDLVGPFPPGPAQKKFLLVSVDYFSKWVEAEALARITEEAVMKFLWKNIVCRYGIPRRLVSDNGRQFQGRKLREWCENLQIQQAFTSVAYPQSNGQVEVVNRELVRGLKIKLEHVGGSWVEELPSILWAYRTTPKESTGMTPFQLVYGSEAVVPVEIGGQAPRIIEYQTARNEVARREELDLIEELREQAASRLARYRQRMSLTYNRRVIPRTFQVGDLVWKKRQPAGEVGKLEPRWEGPFKITRRLSSASYYLQELGGKELLRPWNAFHLRPYRI